MEEEILKAIPALRNSIPKERLAGIAIVRRESGLALQIAVTPGPEVLSLRSEVNDLAGNGSFEVVQVDGGASIAKRESEIEERFSTWQRRIPNFEGAYIDQANGRTVLVVPADSQLTEGELLVGDEAATYLRGRYSFPADSLGDMLVGVEGSSPGADMNRGGRNMKSCTLGFTVRVERKRTRKRMLTAGHCPSYQPWYRFGSSLTMATTRVGTQHNNYSDFAWYRDDSTAKVRGRAYYSSKTSTVANKHNGLNVQGMSVCHRGMTTGFSCGTVISVSYAPGYGSACPGNCEPRFVLTGGDRGEGGDSGGPVWAAGIVPVGIYKGSNEGAGRNHRSWYSKLGNMPAAMGMLVPGS